ncbi:exonuclease domain-containing protein [Caulobacter sp. CCNWLY153]|uniref:exonuclease domain-containing protein n=1 Tax=unclassified Caulobacter TaxID=2648921 RepID=UPI002FEECFA0
MSFDQILVVDLEGTDFPPDAGVVEIGTCRTLILDDGPIALPCHTSIFVNPGRPIPPEASAVHHIIDSDVAPYDSFEKSWPLFLAPEDRALAAHQADYERAFIKPDMTGDRPWICTWKSALRLWPEAPSHGLQALRYYLGLAGVERAQAAPPHRAGPDAYVCAHLLAHMLTVATVGQLIAWSAEPALQVKVPFGQHRGQRWTAMDDGFLVWVLERDFDEHVHFTARHEQSRRAQLAAAA